MYSCQAGTWVFAARCALVASTDLDGGVDADAAASTCQAPTEQSACPPLVDPECDARILDGCPEEACTTGCDSFLRCDKGDWSASYVAYCDADGNLVRVTP